MPRQCKRVQSMQAIETRLRERTMGATTGLHNSVRKACQDPLPGPLEPGPAAVRACQSAVQ